MVMRVGGLATGMDTDAIVKEMMKARRAPVNKLLQRKQTLEWQREDYRSMNSKILDFRNTKLFEFKKESTLTAKKVSMSGPSDVISVSPTGDAVNGTYNIEVSQMARAATRVSTPLWANNTPSSALLKDGLSGLANGVDSGSGDPASEPRLYKIKINDVEFTFDKTVDTLNSVIDKINGSDAANVTAIFSNGKLSVASKSTGASSRVQISDEAGNLAQQLFNNAASSTVGQDAIVTVNGITSNQASNSFRINGLSISINGLSPELTSTTRASTMVDVKSDIDKIVDSVKGFINDYNELLKTITDKINENRFRTFNPLLPEQKESMKEKEVELWENKAKSGLIRNDPILSQLLGDMRTAVYSSVNTGSNKYKTISSLGIVTGSYQDNGKLYLTDEAKLREAIEKEPGAVMKLFTIDNDGAGKKGVAELMYDSLYSAITQMSEKAGTSRFSTAENFKLNANSIMGKQESLMDTQISTWNKKLATLEANYYKQFTAMEKTISKYNSQSAYLMNAMGQR